MTENVREQDGGSLGVPTIARIWRGATREEDRLGYRESLRADVRDVRSSDGNVAAFILERQADGRAEFLFISLWESMEAVVGFAGPEPGRAVYFRDDERFLVELTPFVEHYEIVAQDWPTG
jgi:heme-degrading monooxygenase HmoA